MKVRFTPSARAQFLAALRYIRDDNPHAAKRFRAVAEKSLRRLSRFPSSGRSIPELPELPFREVIVAPYRFFYTVRADTTWIVAVWHGAQRPQDPSRA